jgi:hypothetical protein
LNDGEVRPLAWLKSAHRLVGIGRPNIDAGKLASIEPRLEGCALRSVSRRDSSPCRCDQETVAVKCLKRVLRHMEALVLSKKIEGRTKARSFSAALQIASRKRLTALATHTEQLALRAFAFIGGRVRHHRGRQRVGLFPQRCDERL